jgi:uncharacterized protein YegL
MAGDPLNSVEIGFHKMLSALKRNPYALETVHISIISFAAKAKVLAPLTELSKVNPPPLTLRPGTSLGAALDLLRESIQNDVIKTTSTVKGDYRPLAFILTDGYPTDDWESALNRLTAVKPAPAHIYAIGCGSEVNFETLSQIADVCLQVDAVTGESLANLFVWLTASIQSASVSPEAPLSLLKNIPLEKNLTLIDKERPPKYTDQKNYLFLHVTCRKTRQHFMSRYRYSPQSQFYVAEAAIPLPDDFFQEGSMKAPAVDAGLLAGLLECPYCHDQGWGKCGFCGHLFCLPSDHFLPEITCPFCQTTLKMRPDDEPFSVDGSVG